ncbi:MAG: SHOCT-like domain-containing protein [Planctomycetota bacterium]
MNEERKQLLDMLAQGKISAEDAERLMDKLEAGNAGDTSTSASATPEQSSRFKYLRVIIDSSDGDKVNVRVPLALIRAGIKLTAVLPNNVNEELDKKGVDLSKISELDSDDLYAALRELQVDVDSGDGDVVRVFCE